MDAMHVEATIAANDGSEEAVAEMSSQTTYPGGGEPRVRRTRPEIMGLANWA